MLGLRGFGLLLTDHWREYYARERQQVNECRGVDAALTDGCCKIPISNNVGHVKHYVRTRLRALVEERHFALVGGLRFPTRARS